MSHVLHADVWSFIPTGLTYKVPETTGITANISNTILLICIEIALTIVSHAKGAETIPQFVIVSVVSSSILGLLSL